jgi:hypothetical protein
MGYSNSFFLNQQGPIVYLQHSRLHLFYCTVDQLTENLSHTFYSLNSGVDKVKGRPDALMLIKVVTVVMLLRTVLIFGLLSQC